MQRLLVLTKKGLVEKPRLNDVPRYLTEGALVWLDVEGSDEGTYGLLERTFKAHPVVLDEIRGGYSLPKIISYPDWSFIIWQAVKYESVGSVSFSAPLMYCLVSKNYLVTLHAEPLPAVSAVWSASEPEATTLLKRGTGMVLYNILDGFVDDYFLSLDDLSDQVDALEDKMFGEPSQADVKKLFALKRGMLALRRAAAPEREVINAILRRDLAYVRKPDQPYFEDLYDHLVRIIDLIDTFRDVTSGAMQIYLANVSNKLNTIMKTLTIVATIMMPATLISSFFGMNFALISEGIGRSIFWFTGSVVAMVLIGVVMIYWAWLKKWL